MCCYSYCLYWQQSHEKFLVSEQSEYLSVLCDGKPTPASLVYVRNGFFENLAELSRALHFGCKSGDGQYLSLFEEEGVNMDQNFILGQEFESFSQKGPLIESGINTLNSHSDSHSIKQDFIRVLPIKRWVELPLQLIQLPLSIVIGILKLTTWKFLLSMTHSWLLQPVLVLWELRIKVLVHYLHSRRYHFWKPCDYIS